MKRWLLRAGVVLFLAFVVIQFVPVSRTNPPATAPLEAPAEVAAVLRRACYDCHSNETVWPWYAYVAPVSWLVVRDTDEGREHLNFSTWGTLKPKARASKAAEVVEEIEEGEMPLAPYLWLHPEARLAAAELELLRRWSDEVAAQSQAAR
ncbi:MAG: heme-binding domain-containing protein [Planctomycetes bacterium]|nr:heme-binding domain-containing protein [Planctomycetota bacterium]